MVQLMLDSAATLLAWLWLGVQKRRGKFWVEGVVQSPTDKPEGDLIDPNLFFLLEGSMLLSGTAW